MQKSRLVRRLTRKEARASVPDNSLETLSVVLGDPGGARLEADFSRDFAKEVRESVRRFEEEVPPEGARTAR